MAYTNNKKVVEMVAPILEVMLKSAEGKPITIPTSEPTRVSYKLREALRIIENHSAIFPHYSKLVGKYRIKQQRDCVLLSPKLTLNFGNPIAELAASFKTLEVPEATDALEVIGALIKHKAPKIIFTGAEVDTILTTWLESSDYEITSENPLTIEKRAEANSAKDGGASN